MSPLPNPYSLEPCSVEHFVGRTGILARWRERLTSDTEAWRDGKSWMLIGPGGIGKTSLLRRMENLARDQCHAWTLFLDLGHYRDLDSPSDLFDYLRAHIPPATRLGTRVRQWFGLQPDASPAALGVQIARTLLSKSAVAFPPAALAGLSLELAGPTSPAAQHPAGIEDQLGQLLNALDVLSEERGGPVVVFLDQVGKIHDSYRWRFIGNLLLAMVAQTRQEGAGNLTFVLSFRPERKGLLEYQLSRSLLSEFIYHIEDLHPFTPEEGVQAVEVRAGAYLTQPIATSIVEAAVGAEGVDPYSVQLGAMAVWEYLYAGESMRSPTELTQAEIARIVGDGYAHIVKPYRQRYAHWELLKLLAFHPGGLRSREITRQLQAIPDGSISPRETETVLTDLVQPAGYRLISIIEDGPEPRYTLAHDLLREHIVAEIPEEQRRVDQARKLLSDGIWRYQTLGHRLSAEELEMLWQYRGLITLAGAAWTTIAASALATPVPCLFEWRRAFPDQIDNELAVLEAKPLDPVQSARLHLVQVQHQPSSARLASLLHALARQPQAADIELLIGLLARLGKQALPALRELTHSVADPWMRVQAARSLCAGGEFAPAAAIFTQLARTAEDQWVRRLAANGLGLATACAIVAFQQMTKDQSAPESTAAAPDCLKVGASTVTILEELATTDDDQAVQEVAASTLGWLPFPALIEKAASILARLARTADSPEVQRKAAQSLGIMRTWVNLHRRQDAVAVNELAGMGESIRAALTELAKAPPTEEVQQEAAAALGLMGDHALAVPILSHLADAAMSHKARQKAADALIRLGRGDLAVTALTELAHRADTKDVQRAAATSLSSLGASALVELRSLALIAVDLGVQQVTAGALGKMGETDLAIEILAQVARTTTDQWVCREAAKALGQLGAAAQDALEALASAAIDPRVRLEAATALGRLGQTELALAVLHELVATSRDQPSRIAAAVALGSLGDYMTAVSVLIDLARTAQDRKIQRDAASALGRLDEPALSALLELAWSTPLEEPGPAAILAIVSMHTQSTGTHNAVEVFAVQDPDPALALLDAGAPYCSLIGQPPPNPSTI